MVCSCYYLEPSRDRQCPMNCSRSFSKVQQERTEIFACLNEVNACSCAFNFFNWHFHAEGRKDFQESLHAFRLQLNWVDISAKVWHIRAVSPLHSSSSWSSAASHAVKSRTWLFMIGFNQVKSIVVGRQDLRVFRTSSCSVRVVLAQIEAGGDVWATDVWLCCLFPMAVLWTIEVKTSTAILTKA